MKVGCKIGFMQFFSWKLQKKKKKWLGNGFRRKTFTTKIKDNNVCEGSSKFFLLLRSILNTININFDLP